MEQEIKAGLKFTSIHFPMIAEVVNVNEKENELSVLLTRPDGSSSWQEDNWNLQHTKWGFERNDYTAITDTAHTEGKEGFTGGKWYDAVENKPPIDLTDRWNEENRYSVRCITKSGFGIRFGQYLYNIDSWNIEGCSGPKGTVTHFMIINEPD